ncbi:hypothetical protein MYX76_19195, partial [Desulfobacterota bacterium AH_259_B03_O07]|nr:hypothetical protein [Desulfobacterota bacterium AH_259_B03_O07]
PCESRLPLIEAFVPAERVSVSGQLENKEAAVGLLWRFAVQMKRRRGMILLPYYIRFPRAEVIQIPKG